MRTVIVGGGVAGMTAALDLARRGLGDVHVLSDEPHPYYYRPQLTEFLAGNLTMDKLVRRPLSYYEERGIYVHLGTPVTALHPTTKTIMAPGAGQIAYDKLLLAMGSVPFVPPIKGADRQGVYTWRTLDDTIALERAASMCGNIVVIGGGLLGLEAARGLRSFCPRITVVEALPRLMPRQLDIEAANLLQSFVESLGIEVLVGTQTSEITGKEAVDGVLLQDGRFLPAQLVLVAAGVRCNSALATAAGIATDRGIVVDGHLQTSEPDIYAAGDVAVFKGYSWAIAPIAQAQARVAAANIAGEDVLYDVVIPSTTLKVVGIDVASIGLVNPENSSFEEIGKLYPAEGIYRKIILQDGTIVGAIAINDKNLAKDLEVKIAARASLTHSDAARLVGL